MQPSHGLLCTFWLTALISALERATTLHQALVPMIQLTGYIWTYTGAAVPRKLQARLMAAIVQLKHAAPREPACEIDLQNLEQWAPVLDSAPYVTPQVICLREALCAVAATDSVLSQHDAAAQLRTGLRALQVETAHKDAMPLELVVALWGVLHRLYQSFCLLSANNAGPRNTVLVLTCSWRGMGLVSSPYGLMHKRPETERILLDVQQYSVAELVASGKAYMMALVNALAHEQPMPHNPACQNERYGRHKREWNVQLVAVQRWRQPVLPLSKVARYLQSRGGTHLPVMTFDRGSEELREEPLQVKQSKLVLGQQYHELLGWPPSALPSEVRDEVINSHQDYVRTQISHKLAIQAEVGCVFSSALAEMPGMARIENLPSLQLAPLVNA